MTVLALATPGILSAQQAGAPSPELQQQVEGWLAEMQQINGQLQEIQVRAMQDPELSAAHASLNENLRDAMLQADPTLNQSIERMQELDTEATAARQAGDQAKFQQLAMEAQQIQQRFAVAQQTAVQNEPALATEMTEFQTRMTDKMVSLDPQAETLLTRLEQLQTRLAGAMQAAQQNQQ